MKKISAIEMAMKLVGGKYKCLILYHLSSRAKRTRDLLSLLDGISPKVLTEQLRQLEADGLVSRATFAEGRTFVPVLQRLCDWGWEYDQRHEQTVQPCATRIDG